MFDYFRRSSTDRVAEVRRRQKASISAKMGRQFKAEIIRCQVSDPFRYTSELVYLRHMVNFLTPEVDILKELYMEELRRANSLELSLAEAEDKTEELNNALTRSRGLRQTFEERIANCTRNLAKSHKQVATQEAQLTDCKAENENLASELSTVRTQIAKQDSELAHCEAKNQTFATELSNTRTQIAKQQAELTDCKAENQNLTSELSNARTQITELEAEFTGSKENVEDITADMINARTQIAEQKAELTLLKTRLGNNDSNHDMLQTVLHQLSNFRAESRDATENEQLRTSKALEAVADLSTAVASLDGFAQDKEKASIIQSLIHEVSGLCSEHHRAAERQRASESTILNAIGDLTTAFTNLENTVLTQSGNTQEAIKALAASSKSLRTDDMTSTGKHSSLVTRKREVTMLGATYMSTKEVRGKQVKDQALV